MEVITDELDKLQHVLASTLAQQEQYWKLLQGQHDLLTLYIAQQQWGSALQVAGETYNIFGNSPLTVLASTAEQVILGTYLTLGAYVAIFQAATGADTDGPRRLLPVS
jgi:hypothetical protein